MPGNHPEVEEMLRQADGNAAAPASRKKENKSNNAKQPTELLTFCGHFHSVSLKTNMDLPSMSMVIYTHFLFFPENPYVRHIKNHSIIVFRIYP